MPKKAAAKVAGKVKEKAKGAAKAGAEEEFLEEPEEVGKPEKAHPAQGSLLAHASLKEGFDAHANEFGYIKTTDKKAVKSLAGFLGLDAAVVEKEMKAIDFDANDHVSFAEFALWADRHTVGVKLGIDVPDKREWRKGMPTYWTSLPPEEPLEIDAAAIAQPPAVVGRGPAAASDALPSDEVPEDPDTSELEALIGAAKDFEWDTVWEILGRHPGYVNMRPPLRRYAAIHQAAYHGDVAVLRRYVEEFHGDPQLATKDGETPEQVAKENGNAAAVEFLAGAVAAKSEGPPAKRLKVAADAASGSEVTDPALLDKANEMIEHAKWQHWDVLFEGLAAHPAAMNVRPPLRRWAVIHQAAYAGDVSVLKRLVEGNADPGLLTRDKETALQIAKAESNAEAAEFLASLEKKKGGGQGEGGLIEQAHRVIDAAKNGDWAETFKLLDAGPKGLVNTRPTVRQYGILHQAAFHGDIEVLRKLIEDYKANVKQLTKDGQTALQIAQSTNQQAAAKYLEACTPTIALEDDFVKYPEQKFVKVTHPEDLDRFRRLLEKSHKSICNWTRDRDWASGVFEFKTPVPTGYEVVGVLRNENPALWRIFQVSREIAKMECAKVRKEAPFSSWTPITMEPANGLDWSDRAMCGGANEWLLFHASLPEALTAIARTGFTMAKLGSGGTTGSGGLYGNGTYFADSITKADEYARRKVEGGEFAGTRAAALCRVLGGRHFYTDKEVKESDKPKFHKRVLQGHYHSTVGDRLKLKNSFREYVVYDSSATYLEYIIFYRRLGVPKKHE